MKRSAETRARISAALMGHRHSEATLAKLRGRIRSPQARANISAAMKGKMPWNKGKTGIYSDATRASISASLTGKKRSKASCIKQSITMTGSTQAIEHVENNRKSQIQRFYGLIPDYVPHAGASRRKQRILKNGGHHSKAQWEAVKAKFNHTCPSCGHPEPQIRLTKDHIVPAEKGGSDDIENIQPLCKPCNSKKHNKIIKFKIKSNITKQCLPMSI